MTLHEVEHYLRGHDLWKFRELLAKAHSERRSRDSETVKRLQRILDGAKPRSDRHAVGE